MNLFVSFDNSNDKASLIAVIKFDWLLFDNASIAVKVFIDS